MEHLKALGILNGEREYKSECLAERLFSCNQYVSFGKMM